eukprot:NODE_381_length_9671_cov_0.208838.p1 type:complete len:1268 gc:universal NODE_381_length_9671_cov_0.208838:3521-7324(+)
MREQRQRKSNSLNLHEKFEKLKSKQSIFDYEVNHESDDLDDKAVFDDDFVVNDQGRGYVDYGQDTYMNYDEDELMAKSKKVNTIQNAFINMKKQAVAKPKVNDAQADAHFDAILADLDFKPQSVSKRKASTTAMKSGSRKKKSRVSFQSSKPFDQIISDNVFENNLNEPLEAEDSADRFESITTQAPPDVPKISEPLQKLTLTKTLDLEEMTKLQNSHLVADGEEVGLTDAAPVEVEVEINLEDKNELALYYMDAYENQGVVYLFGKIFSNAKRKYVSCCVRIKNIERNLYVLPRPYLLDDENNETDQLTSMQDVFLEFNEYRKKYHIKEMQAKQVVRKYAFDIKDVPKESEYLKVMYSYEASELPSDAHGKSFSKIFGTKTSSLEHFLIKRKLMGPGWIKIRNYILSDVPYSWCDVEYTLNDPKHLQTVDANSVTTLPNTASTIPKLTLMSLHLNTLMNQKTNQNEIVALTVITCLDFNINDQSSNFHYSKTSMVRQPSNMTLPFDYMASKGDVVVHKSEKSLLSQFISLITKFNPDVLIGHAFSTYHSQVLFDRLKHYNFPSWSKLGRLRRKQFTKTPNFQGRMVCDTFIILKDLLSGQQSYALSDLINSQLKMDLPAINTSRIQDYFTSSTLLNHLMASGQHYAMGQISLLVKLQVFPTTIQLTNLAGNTWSRTMNGARSERNEYLLLHTFHKLKFIVPDKKAFTKSATNKKNKPLYKGGLVLDPLVGFYDNFVLLLDFNSLYPSIIQEYNICFTTVEGDDLPADQDLGVLPSLLRNLVEERGKVKNLIKISRDDKVKSSLDIRQKALKLTANSMYGCLGFINSRFYAQNLAKMITSQGRFILSNTVQLANNMGLQVIYGDTDSIMINTNSQNIQEVIKMGKDFQVMINNKYKTLELGIDGYLRKLLLLKKKKYAALVYNEYNHSVEQEIKGLDMVRRDWCGLTKTVCHYILNELMSKEKDDAIQSIYSFLTKLKEDIVSGNIKSDEYIIYKSITKDIKDYDDAKTLPHVQVAIKMVQDDKVVRIGDVIPYVICTGSSSSYATRAFHPENLKGNIDIEWYIKQQLFPPIQRLCAPIKELDLGQVAMVLGVHYNAPSTVGNNNELECYLNMEFKTIVVECSGCAVKYGVDYFINPIKPLKMGFTCNQCKLETGEARIYNLLIKHIREEVREYYQRYQTNGRLYVLNHDDYENSSNRLHMMMIQFKRAFDFGEIKKICKTEELIRYTSIYERLCLMITKELNEMMKWSECNEIPLGKLFKRAGLSK